MKRGLIFFLGMIAGCVLTVAALVYVAKVYNVDDDSGLELYEQPVGSINSYSFRVLQVLPNGNALAYSESELFKDVAHTGPVVLLLSDESSHYYDDQIVRVPKGKRAVQMGVYQYETNEGMHKTVPVVRIMSK